MSRYPTVLGEDETLEAALAGVSLARYGDGELKLCLGKNCISQVADPALARELIDTLNCATKPWLACIPNVDASPNRTWPEYRQEKYTQFYQAGTVYGSSFITRPDSAPWIDRPDYWHKVEDLWRGRDITLVLGTDRSLRQDMLGAAASIREVRASIHRDAYAEINAIEEQIGVPSGPVLMCLGATATVLAARLARKGVHALDLGHIGMFMRHAGSYRHRPDALASDAYRAQLRHMHQRRWGADGAKHLGVVLMFADEIAATTVLDYGCGENKLAEGAKPVRRITGYDPGIPDRAGAPKPADLVVCTDVLEHVEPQCLDSVLNHIFCLAGKAAYMVIATRPAKAILPDGRNAHLIVESPAWWMKKLEAQGWGSIHAETREGRDMSVWLRK